MGLDQLRTTIHTLNIQHAGSPHRWQPQDVPSASCAGASIPMGRAMAGPSRRPTQVHLSGAVIQAIGLDANRCGIAMPGVNGGLAIQHKQP